MGIDRDRVHDRAHEPAGLDQLDRLLRDIRAARDAWTDAALRIHSSLARRPAGPVDRMSGAAIAWDWLRTQSDWGMKARQWAVESGEQIDRQLAIVEGQGARNRRRNRRVDARRLRLIADAHKERARLLTLIETIDQNERVLRAAVPLPGPGEMGSVIDVRP
jgi:hypothetical protein